MNGSSLEMDVLEQAHAWFNAGEAVVLATVTHTWGSAPRPVGSILAVSASGRLAGSVSGGCIEDDLLNEFGQAKTPFSLPLKREYGVTADQAHRFGLPCGGTMRLILEPVTVKSRLPELLSFLEGRRLILRELDMSTGEVTYVTISKEASLSETGGMLRACFGPTHRLLLIGAGQMSSFVATNALALGYEVGICEPREEYMNSTLQKGITYSSEMPDDWILASALDQRAAVIALTHDPKLDDLALMEALRTPAFYVAAIGSRKNNALRRLRLAEFDLSAAQIARLKGPAGIHIGALTPAEIGISILAELTAYRHGLTEIDSMSVARGKSKRERNVRSKVLSDSMSELVM